MCSTRPSGHKISRIPMIRLYSCGSVSTGRTAMTSVSFFHLLGEYHGRQTANESREEAPHPHEGRAAFEKDAEQGDADAVAPEEAAGEQARASGIMILKLG